MALIKCPECNNEISDTARSCPKCGFRRKKATKEIIKKATKEIINYFDFNKIIILTIILYVVSVIISLIPWVYVTTGWGGSEYYIGHAHLFTIYKNIFFSYSNVANIFSIIIFILLILTIIIYVIRLFKKYKLFTFLKYIHILTTVLALINMIYLLWGHTFVDGVSINTNRTWVDLYYQMEPAILYYVMFSLLVINCVILFIFKKKYNNEEENKVSNK